MLSKKKFERRKVLQLDSKPQTTFGFGYKPPEPEESHDPTARHTSKPGIALLPQYAEEIEEEAEPLQKFVAAKEPDPTLQRKQNGKPEDDVDAKVQDFLAEIDAIEQAVGPVGKEAEEAPEEPVCVWQQLMDEATCCYYYWNQDTNEVTWEIPAAYSQYLLLMKEYEAALARCPPGTKKQDSFASSSVHADGSKQHEGKAEHQVLKDNVAELDREHAIKSSDMTSSTELEVKEDLEAPEEPIIGPQLPEQLVAKEVDEKPVFGPQLPADPTVLFNPKSPMSDNIEQELDKALEQSATCSTTKVESSKCLDSMLAAKQKQLASIQELATGLLDRLHFLDINCKDISQLQLLLIQLETRLEDWSEGALSSPYLLRKLLGAKEQLEQYEFSVAPAGWKCAWDSAKRRYLYEHLTTGMKQEAFPDEPPLPPPPLSCNPPEEASLADVDFEVLAKAPPLPPGEPPPPGTSSPDSTPPRNLTNYDVDEGDVSMDIDDPEPESPPPPPSPPLSNKPAHIVAPPVINKPPSPPEEPPDTLAAPASPVPDAPVEEPLKKKRKKESKVKSSKLLHGKMGGLLSNWSKRSLEVQEELNKNHCPTPGSVPP